MDDKFLISGGIPRVFGELMAGHVFKMAELAEIDFEKKTYRSVFNYKTPPEFCADYLPSITFSCFCISQDKIYLPTRTEILVLDSTSYKIIEIITDPLFNDIHDVLVLNGKLYVAVTGMDAVFIYDLKTKQREIINVLGEDPFKKYSVDDKLNKVNSLKPHKAHPNHLFAINGDVWVTRLKKKDAVNLRDLSKKIEIVVGLPHDGFVKGDFIYFTTVNGYIVIFETKTLKKIKSFKLTGAEINCDTPLGWCRGLYVSDTHIYVGFTKLRTTKITENLDWVKTMVEEKKIIKKPLATRIEKYSLNGDFVSEFIFPKNGIYNIFSIIKKD